MAWAIDEPRATWAMLASLIETCKLHGVNPQTYLTDVLTKLVNNWPNNGSPNSRPGAGLPHTDRRRRTKPACQPAATVAMRPRFLDGRQDRQSSDPQRRDCLRPITEGTEARPTAAEP